MNESLNGSLSHFLQNTVLRDAAVRSALEKYIKKRSYFTLTEVL